MRLADPAFELRYVDTNEMVLGGYYYHMVNAIPGARREARMSGREVRIIPFSGWES